MPRRKARSIFRKYYEDIAAGFFLGAMIAVVLWTKI
jgi:hypothetical protein